jgi:Tfp pilus assembly protein PilV
MLVAVFILFIGIVGLVLYLVVQSYSRGRSEQYDASSLVEEYANNRMITQQGDVVFCYRLFVYRGGIRPDRRDLARGIEGSAAGYDHHAQRPL